MADKPLKDLLAIIYYTILSIFYTILHKVKMDISTRVHEYHLENW